MLFKRKIYDKLLEWKKSEGGEAVLIEGARRIGKSTVATEFAKNEYKSYILIDFANVSGTIKDCFNDLLNDLDRPELSVSKYCLAQNFRAQERR